MRTRRRILTLIIIGVVAVVVVLAAFFTGLIVIPKDTELTISPYNFTVVSGSSTVMTAKLVSGSFVVSGRTITWSASQGSFDKTVGNSVIYTAPTVTRNTSVTITVSFGGDRNYRGSSATATALVTPREATSTTLSISPSTFEVESNGTLTFTVALTPSSAPSSIVTWSISGPGTLSSATGASTTYRAPEVGENTTVTITATFPGTSEYSSSTFTCTGFVLPPGAAIRKATTLTISPAGFVLMPSEAVTLTAVLKDLDGNNLAGKPITWSLDGPGTLSSEAGTSVTYTAPGQITEETTITLKATFPGDENYLSTETISERTILPTAPVATDEYVLRFDSATMHNVRFEGPVMISGRETTKVTCDIVNMLVPTISRIGLSGSSADITNLQMYVTYVDMYSPSLNTTLRYIGKSNATLGPMESATFENGTIFAVFMTSQTMQITAAKVKAEYIGGSEPYKPLIFEVTEALFKNNYGLYSPDTYGELVDRATKMVMGELETPGFSLVAPVSYNLNRTTMNYTYTGKWQMQTTNCTASNVLFYSIYSKSLAVKSPEIILEFTGDMPTPPMYGFETGSTAMVYESTTHLVYLSADKITMNSVTLSIL